MLSMLRVVTQVIIVLWALIQLVERPGDGAAKKEEVAKHFRAWTQLLQGKVPNVLYEFLVSGPFISFVIDTIVWFANAYGFFQHSAPEAGSQST